MRLQGQRSLIHFYLYLDVYLKIKTDKSFDALIAYALQIYAILTSLDQNAACGKYLRN